MKKAFTLIELLVVIGVIALLLAIIVPGLRYAREMGRETVCRSNLRQLAIIMKTYTNEHNHLFPSAPYIYHSRESFRPEVERHHPRSCRWHDERIGLDSELMREHPELRGSLWPYLGNKEILLCQVGRKANNLRGCCNGHLAGLPVATQYTYAMNTHLGSTITTGGTDAGSVSIVLDKRTIREVAVRRTSQVTRNPSEVFVFGEQNSWAINTDGIQPGRPPSWPADYNLSGRRITLISGHRGTLRLPHLEIASTYRIIDGRLARDDDYIGHAFATCHRPKNGDLNTGFSFAGMLDGHVEKITVADQLRQSRRVPGLDESRLGPGGNLARAWPLDVPPPGGWENQ